MSDMTPYERLEAAIKASDAAEEALVAKGAAASDEDHKAADEAAKAMTYAAEAFQRSENGKGVKALLEAGPADRVDGKTFDQIAEAKGIVNPQGMTVGEAFVKSGAFAELVDRHLTADGKIAEGVKSRTVDFGIALTQLRNDLKFVDEGDDVALKTLVTGLSDTSGGALVGQPQRLPGVADQVPFRRNRLWDLCTRIPLTGDALEYVEITSKTNNAAPVAEATSAGGLASAGHTDAVTDAAGGLKPESALAMQTVVNLVETIAHWVPLTRRAASDAPQLRSIIDAFLVGGLNVVAENQMMSGNGTSPNLRGLINTTNAYNLQSIDASVDGGSRLDIVAKAAALIMSALEEVHEPTALLVHPLDWMTTDFALAKDSNGAYFGAGPFASLEALRQVWGLRVVLTKAVPQGTQVLGDFNQALIGDREQSAVYMTDSHADYFTRNILTMLGETRLSFGVRVPQAFVTIVP